MKKRKQITKGKLQRRVLSSKGKSNYAWLLFALIIIVFLFLLHKIKKEEIESEEKENVALKDLFTNKKEKKELLEKRVVKYYRLTKWILFSSIITAAGTLIYIQGLGDALNYINALVLFIVILSAAAFDKPSDITKLLKLLKSQIENWVYRNDKDINNEIENIKNQIEHSDTKLTEMKKERTTPELTDEKMEQILNALNEDFIPSENKGEPKPIPNK